MTVLETKTLSPKELAQVVGVSESSIKRWVDSGLINVQRTAGGHRRILLREALRFIRGRSLPVLRPDVLGLPEVANLPVEARTEGVTGPALLQLLQQGDAEKVRSLLAAHYMDGHSVARLFDGPMAEALAALGTLWQQGEEGIYLEHLATHICIEALNHLRILMPKPPQNAPVALGSAPPNDPYIVPSLMASTVLTDMGYETTNLGPDTPYAALLHAVQVHQPALVWLAVTSPLTEKEATALAEKLLRPLRTKSVEVVVGGKHVAALYAYVRDGVHFMNSMQELAAFATDRYTV